MSAAMRAAIAALPAELVKDLQYKAASQAKLANGYGEGHPDLVLRCYIQTTAQWYYEAARILYERSQA